MKKIPCTAVGGPDTCDYVFEIRDFEDFLIQAPGHFGNEHTDILRGESEEEKKNWEQLAQTVIERTTEEPAS